MWTALLVASRTSVVTLVLTCVLYPLAVTVLAQLAFPHQANGSRVTNEQSQTVGSALIGQPFSQEAYLHPRPSAAGAGYDATSSGGSNLGPTSRKLRERTSFEAARLRKQNPRASPELPAELVTTSGSGLDPHISPRAALWQAARIADARGIALERIEAAIRANEESRTLGLLGEPRVNVLLTNLALDRQFGRPREAARGER